MIPSPEHSNGSGQKALLEMKGICKAFGHVQALDRVDFEMYPGEVVALVGDNGAGKSTLVKILSGVYQADTGDILVNGQHVKIRTPADAQRLSIATVFQDLALVDTRDVASNIFLGREPMRWAIIIDRRKMWADAEAVLRTLQIDMPSVKVDAGELSGGQRQAVAVGRAISRGERIFLMDEPTAALGVQQSEKVKELIGDLRAHGHAVLVISHNLAHVFDVADRLIVLRHGQRVGSRVKSETTPEEIVGLITGAIRGVV